MKALRALMCGCCCVWIGSLSADDEADHHLTWGSVSFYSENDKYFAGTDQYYTNGFKISALSGALNNFTDHSVPHPIRFIAQTLEPVSEKGADYKLGVSLGQNLYTPVNIHTPVPQPNDRPYAAWLYAGTVFQNYLPAQRRDGSTGVPRLDVYEFNVGTVGPNALGQQIQNSFHDIINAPHAQGWANQIHNEPGINIIFERKYRFQTDQSRTGWSADFIPHGGGSLGNVFTYANLGAEGRAGWRLPRDFGTDLIRPSGDSNSRVPPAFSSFLFVGVNGRAVLRDITLDGNSFRSSPSVDKKPLVGDLLGGIALGFKYFQITYAQVVRSKEFYGQGNAQVFGSISTTFFISY